MCASETFSVLLPNSDFFFLLRWDLFVVGFFLISIICRHFFIVFFFVSCIHLFAQVDFLRLLFFFSFSKQISEATKSMLRKFEIQAIKFEDVRSANKMYLYLFLFRELKAPNRRSQCVWSARKCAFNSPKYIKKRVNRMNNGLFKRFLLTWTNKIMHFFFVSCWSPFRFHCCGAHTQMDWNDFYEPKNISILTIS